MSWSVDCKILEWVNHFELLKRLSEKQALIVDHVRAQTAFTDESVKVMLDPLAEIYIDNPKYQLTAKRLGLIKKIICMRRDILKQAFGLN